MTRVLLLLLLSFAVSVQAKERPQPEYSLRATGDLEIGPDGSVRSWKMDSEKLGATIEGLVQRNVETWRFEPILKDGKPVIAKTRMSVGLLALPQGDGMLVKVEEVHFGALKASGTIRPPRYPAKALREALGARVLLMVRVAPDGQVTDVHPYQVSLSKQGRASVEEGWRAMFARASVDAVSKWKYEPGESIADVPVSQVIFVPIHFQIGEPGKRAEHLWHGFYPGPVTPAPWADAGSMAQVDVATLDEGESAGVGSPFKLLGEVVGKTL
jgi:hypothetical protein